MNELRAYIAASRDVLDILKTLTQLLPKGGKEADFAEQTLVEAQKVLRASEVQLAKVLGYRLCQCDFPPHIMLSKGYHPEYGNELFVCTNCNKQEPSDVYFRGLDRMRDHNRRLDSQPNSWMER